MVFHAKLLFPLEKLGDKFADLLRNKKAYICAMLVTQEQIAGLAAMCDALLPSIEREEDPDGYWRRTASDLDIADKMLAVVAGLPKENQDEFIDLLDFLKSPTLGLSGFEPLKPATELTIAQRQSVLQSWSKSPISSLRQAFMSLKRLCCFIYFGYSNAWVDNPNWKTLGYPGPPKGERPSLPEMETIAIHSKSYLTCEVVIVGSGAGGSVAAAHLAKQGLDVIVVEKGPYVKESENGLRETEVIGNAYERHGALTTLDGAMTIFAGSCLGGGTTINWSGSFRTPDYILEEWAANHHNPQFLDPAYKKCFDTIEQKMQVSTNLPLHNLQNKALKRGAEKLGYHAAPIPLNMNFDGLDTPNDTWKGMGFSILGDVYGKKQGGQRYFLPEATAHGARILVNTEADQVMIEGGKATGIRGWQTDKDGLKHTLEIRADKVIVAAGALHTPALLLRSGLEHEMIGYNLYMHPTVAVSAVYPERMDPWHGPMMSTVCNEFSRLDGNYGVKIEVPPVHSGMLGLTLPWMSGEQFKTDILKAPFLGSFIVLTRDKYAGHVTLSRQKRPLIHYTLRDYDRKHLQRGMQEAIRLHAAAGAEEVLMLHNEMESFNPKTDDLEGFVELVKKKKWSPNRFMVFSAHQMGTCRMGGEKHRHPIRPDGESWEVKGLYVTDASLFPESSGVNPMLSIQALSQYVAEQMK